MKKFLFIFFIILSVLFRFYNLNWDNNQHLHPDERFLTMVGLEMSLPKSLSDYLNPATSTFNPRNLNQDFFVYGNFPLILNKIVALFFNNNNYNSFTIQGRFLSALFDSLTILLVIKFAELIEKKYKLSQDFKFWAGIIYGYSVLLIQLSHFFTVDIFTSFFGFSSFFFTFKFSLKRKELSHKKQVLNIFLSGGLFGLGMASKINTIFLLPLILAMIISIDRKKIIKTINNNLYFFSLFFLTSYFILRIADPYLFKSGNFFNPIISPEFIQNIKTLKSWEGDDVWFPPAIQWIPTTPVFFALKNLVFFGFGIINSIFLFIGISSLLLKAKKLLKNINIEKNKLVFIIIWCVVFFLYQSIQFTKALRYFIFLYPFMAVCSSIGVIFILEKIKKKIKSNFVNTLAIQIMTLILIIIWPLMFMSIYVNDHSRITASAWMYRNLPNSTKLLNELWDDPLPLQINNNYNKILVGEMIPIFDPDSPQKWKKINKLLTTSEYYILSSNRGWGSMTKVPKKYPQTSVFYNQMLENKTNYKKIAEFSSYPSLKYLGIPLEFKDDWADETFTVYDHPKVMIFKNSQFVK